MSNVNTYETKQEYPVPFRPVRGLEAKIRAMDVHEGYVYFATDTGKMFIDRNGTRVSLGGSGAALLYASETNVIDNLDGTYSLSIGSLDDALASPKENDLIINVDGVFFKVLEIDSPMMICQRIAVSGGGDGGEGGGGTVDRYITIEPEKMPPSSYIYGKSSIISFQVNAEKDSQVTVIYKVKGAGGEEALFTDRISSPGVSKCDIGKMLFKGLNKIIVTARGENSGEATLSYSNRQTIVMELLESPSFNPLLPYSFDPDLPKTGTASIEFIPVGPLNKTIVAYVDGIKTVVIDHVDEDNQKKTIVIPRQSHGSHTISLVMSVDFEGENVKTNPLVYELAWLEKNNQAPVIWLGKYNETIVNYDVCTVQYMAYDPNAGYTGNMTVELLKNGNIIKSLSVQASKDHYLIQPISDYEEGLNHYALKCGSTIKEFDIKVLPSEKDLSVITTGQILSLSSDGRSNNESPYTRNKWSYTDEKGISHFVTLNNFNWFNNGWILDNEGKSCLRISNGATASIPFRSLDINSTKDYTFEIRFKVRNIQDYSTLITNTTQYLVSNIESGGTIWIDENDMTEKDFEHTIKNDYGYPVLRVAKTVNTEKGVCVNWLDDSKGFALGTQEAYFSTGGEIVGARYKEDQLITLSFVASKSQKLLSIYLNGILTSVVKLESSFVVRKESLDITSKYCDIDLYDLRIYETELNFAQIVQNYIADKKDVNLYDQNHIYTFKNGIPTIDYASIVAYNKEHPDNPTMPYMTIETEEDDDRLPYFKGNKKKVTVNFVNPCLDKAYIENKIDQDTYLNYCPSFVANTAELNVQGTSSQGYPKRNYKCKFDKEAGFHVKVKAKPEDTELTKDYLDSEGANPKKWHMDNPDCKTRAFTWKIDYMESSGSYNSGLADLLGLSYAKHPMEYYRFPGVDASQYRTTVYGFPVITFHKHHAVGTAASEYEFIGLYNFNLDKGSNEYYGFEEETEQPFVTTPEGKHPLIKDVAECWELRNNQGTYTSYKYPFGVTDFTKTDADNHLEVAKHFEARYNNEEDALELAAEYEFGKSAELADGSLIEFTNEADANKYLLKKYANLEVMFNWLASTDTETATNEKLDHPVTWQVTVHYRADKEGHLIYDEHGQKIPAGSDWAGKTVAESEEKTYTTDNAEYRLQKFIQEFSEHFNKDYCMTYWLITELLLLYDSRGKNCMMATWGPNKEKGNYIWFPIFYDMDTQLGINNSGIPTWEYDTDASQNKVFSTPSSVLWVNMEKAFSNDLRLHFRKMRSGDPTIVKDIFSLENVVGAYNRDPNVFKKSYAMKGVRPMIAFNAGEYVKYLGIMTDGYYDTKGEEKLDSGAWLYIIQGDRELARELFLTNRFNYLDSWLGSAAYSPAQGTSDSSVWMRINANNASDTSDHYLDTSFSGDLPEATELQPYPVKNFDALPEFSITPFLKQYISVGYDDLYTKPEKSNENTVTPTAPTNILQAFKATPNNGSQLIYLPGAEYISSFGDLSSKYVDEFHFTTAKRCKNLLLGSDVPNYYNNLLGQKTTGLILDDAFLNKLGTENANRKSLLDTIVLTGLRSLKTSLDVTGSDKLQEFRALNTQITGVKFAVGAPLDTVHLPKSINSLELIETPSLTQLITESKTIGNGSTSYTGVDLLKPNGLYIEGLTDLKDDGKQHGDTNITSFKIIGNALKYNSYNLLDKLTNIKLRTGASDPEKKSKLAVELQDVLWSPYVLVDTGLLEPESGKVYVYLTEHYTVKPYVYTSQKQWIQDVKNERVYLDTSMEKVGKELVEIPEVKASTEYITDLHLLDNFINDYEGSLTGSDQQFTNLEHSTNKTVPLINGNIYVNNTIPIDEVEIKNKYNNLKYFPDLHIIVKNVKEAQSGTFIEVDTQGKEHSLAVQKVDLSHNWFDSPWNSQKPDIYVIPTRQHYDFQGWKIKTPTGYEEELLTEENWNTYNFSKFSEVNTFVFEAYFTIHNYEVHFMSDNELIETILVPYNTTITKQPTSIPYKNDDNLKLEETYDFYGYGLDPKDTEVFPPDYKVITDLTLYALFTIKNIREAVHPEWFNYYENYTYTTRNWVTGSTSSEKIRGTAISPKKELQLKGKIVLPATDPNGIPIISVTGFGSYSDGDSPLQPGITHVFVQKENNLVEINNNAFSDLNNLRYFDFINAHIKAIGTRAFKGCPLGDDSANLGTDLIYVGLLAFNQAYETNKPVTLVLSSKLEELGGNAFTYMHLKRGSKIVIGSNGNPAPLDLSKPNTSSGYELKIEMNQEFELQGIDFYSTLYSQSEDSIGGGFTVSDCFREYVGTISIQKQ